MIACSLKPKNPPVELLPRAAKPSNTRWRLIRRLSQTAIGVESAIEIPEHCPLRVSNRAAKARLQRGSSSTQRLYEGKVSRVSGILCERSHMIMKLLKKETYDEDRRGNIRLKVESTRTKGKTGLGQTNGSTTP